MRLNLGLLRGWSDGEVGDWVRGERRAEVEEAALAVLRQSTHFDGGDSINGLENPLKNRVSKLGILVSFFLGF